MRIKYGPPSQGIKTLFAIFLCAYALLSMGEFAGAILPPYSCLGPGANYSSDVKMYDAYYDSPSAPKINQFFCSTDGGSYFGMPGVNYECREGFNQTMSDNLKCIRCALWDPSSNCTSYNTTDYYICTYLGKDPHIVTSATIYYAGRVYDNCTYYGADSVAPSAINNLSVSSCTSSTCALSWTAPGDDGSAGTATTYDVRYYTSAINNVNWDLATQATGEPSPGSAGSSQSMTVAGLGGSITYYFAIRTADEVPNWSGLSNVPYRTTSAPPDNTAPTAPQNLTAASIAGSGVQLSWSASTDDSGVIANYYIYRCAGSGCVSFVWLAQTLGTVGYIDSYSDGTGLQPLTTYNYRVVAIDGAGNLSNPSNSAEVTTLSNDTIPPSTPASLFAVPANPPAGSSQINLSWTASTDNIGVAGYRVYRNGTQIATTAAIAYSDTGLIPSTAYSYYVIAYDAAGNTSLQSNTASATTLTPPDTTGPSAPTNLSASAISSSQINLSWTASIDTGGSGLGGYRIYRNGAQVGTTATSATFYTDPGLSPSTSYNYYIIAYDNAGNSSSQSNTVVGITTAAYTGSYNPTTDFSIYNGNPNGVWSYGWMPNDLSTFNLYLDSHINSNTSSPEWYRDPASFGYTPSIWRNDGGSLRYGVAPGQLSLHPSSNFEPSVLRWTAPSDGLYNFAGQFLPGDGNPTIQVGIRQGSNWLWQDVDSGIYNFDRLMIAGESIDFLVYGNYWMGNTPLELTISFSSGSSPAGVIHLPQTGQSTCYDSAGSVIPCAGTGQDGDIRSGISWPNPRFIDNSNGTVTDNLTGLMWTQDANAPGPAVCSPGTAKTWEGALDYVTCLNTNSYLGYTDWHLPNANELESQVNAEQPNTATWLNTQGFSNVQSNSYWSSTSKEDGGPYRAWVVNMAIGEVTSLNKSNHSRSVWPVRSGQSGVAQLWETGQTACYDSAGNIIACAGTGQDGESQAGVAWPSPRFKDNGNGTVTDNLTGLMWTKDANLPGTYKTWQQALYYVNGMNAGIYPNFGYTNWHLPNRKELHSLTDFSRFNPSLPSGHPFLNVVKSTAYWSSTTLTSNPNYAGVVGMWSGDNLYSTKSDFPPDYVWPVRSGQVGFLVHSILGTVTENSIGLGGVTLTLSGPTSATTTTASDGTYSFTNLPDGSYIITPSMSGYAFTPSNRSVTLDGSDVGGTDFVGVDTTLPSLVITANDVATWPGDNRTVSAKFKNTGGQALTISNIQVTGVDWLAPISSLPALSPGQEVELWFRLSVPATATGGAYPNPQVYSAVIGVNTAEGHSFNNAFSINVFQESTSILNIQVLADNTGAPLPGAMVTLEGSATSYSTDSNGRVQITTAPGIKNIYAYKDGYKPLALSANLSPLENNLTLRLHPGEVLVVDQVQVTPLTQQEIIDRGVELTDPTNYWVYDFTVALAIDGIPTTINQTSVVLPTNPAPGTTTILQSTTVQSSGGGTSTIQPTVIALPEGKRAYAFLIIPGEIKLLKEFFEAKVIVKNEAATDFVITGTTAALNIPSALALVPLDGVAQEAAKTLGDIAGGSQAEAAWILRGDAEGEHMIGVNASGVLQPFGLTLTASNSGLVKIYGKPNLSAIFNVPSIVAAGEEFVFAVTVTNTSPVTVNGVSVGLDTGNFVNVHLASGESPVKYIGILPEAGMAGSAQTVEFRLVSEVDGVISTAHSAVYSDPQLLASLTIISCPHGVGEGASDSELTAFTNAYNDAGGYTALGCPQGAVRAAQASGASGSTATGFVQDFDKGHIHLISGDTNAHETLGMMDTVYFDMGGTASQLGFPISDLLSTVEGYVGQYFEGGYMYTDLEGVTHTLFTAQPALIKLDNDYRVYYVQGGLNRHIPDPETFELLRFDWNAITPVTSVGTPGIPVPALRTGSAKDGSLIRRMIGGPGNTIKVYLIENGIARHVPDPDTLFAMWRRFNEVTELESLLLDRIPKGPDIPSVDSSASDDSFIHFVSGFGLDAPAGFVAGVNTAIGNYSHRRTDLVIPGRGLSFALSSTYNAKDSYDHVMGPGWTHSYDMEAMETQKTPPGGTTPVNVFASVKWGDGHEEFYQWDNAASSYKAINGVHNILSGGGGSNTLTVLIRSQVQYVFELLEPITNISQDKNGNQTVITTNRYRLKSISDRNGNAITLNYSGLLSSVTDSVGRTIAFTYTEMTDPSTGTTVTRLTKVTDPIGRTVEFTYDADGKITEIRDPSGGTTKYSYKKDKVMGIPGPLIEEIRDPRGNPAVYNTYKEDMARPDYKNVDSISIGGTPHTISNDGNTATVTDPVSYRKYTHDKNRLTSMADPAGNIGIAYDDLNFMNPNSIKDKMDGYTTFEYDARGNILKATDALGNTARFEYDSRNNLTRKTDPLGRVTTYSYDGNGNLTRVAAPVGTTDITYDSYGQPETVTDANGNTTSFIYDSDGNLSEVRQPLGRTIRYGYDSVGRRISVTDANNNTTTFSYDNNNRLLTVTDPLSKTERYEYDLNGNKTTVIDRNGNRTDYVYDERNRLTRVSEASGNTQYVYDELNRLDHVIDAEGKSAHYEYDAVGNLIKVTDADSGTVEYTYDANGNRLSMTDPNNHTTEYEYDALNRITKKTEPLGGQYRYVYDIAGNMTSMTDAKGNTTQYSYDSMDRLSLITYIDSSTVSFTYDSNGNRIRMVDRAGTTTYTYDALNRLINYTDPYGKTVGYGYDSNGNRISTTYPDGKVVQHGYDNLNRLVSASDWLNRTTTYSYDSASRLTGTVNPNATTVSYSYDNADRLTGLINRKSNSTVISSYSYILDTVGNHTQSAQTEPLMPAMPDRDIGYAYDAENRLTSAGGVNFSFDANGNMEAKGDDTFNYDYRDKLIQSIIAGKITQYQYNGAGDRLSRTEDGVAKRYVLDINSDLPNVLAETDGNGNISAYYVYGLGLMSKVLPDGTAFYYHYDSRGSAIALTDAGQNITDAYAYDPFGKVVNSTGSTPNPFRYVGRYGLMDEGNGLTYVRARYYAPELGRFITKDLMAGGVADIQTINRYTYALNNPVILMDTSGLIAEGGFKLCFIYCYGWEYVSTRDGFYKIESWGRGLSFGAQFFGQFANRENIEEGEYIVYSTEVSYDLKLSAGSEIDWMVYKIVDGKEIPVGSFGGRKNVSVGIPFVADITVGDREGELDTEVGQEKGLMVNIIRKERITVKKVK